MTQLKVGDLVCVIRPTPCCNNHENIGTIFKVSPDKDRHPLAECIYCKWDFENKIGVTVFDGKTFIRVGRLIKIDPPYEGEYDGVTVKKDMPHEV